MKILRILRDYLLYCGIGKDEYNALKKDAYISNFRVWRVLHFLMALVFGTLFVSTFLSDLLKVNKIPYLVFFIYSVIGVFLFFVLKKDSVVAQFLIYLSISMLFLFACFITRNKPDVPAATFIVFLLVTPMFMIDRPVFIALELCAASAVFLVWMYRIKPYDVWQYDFVNVIIFTAVGIVLNIIANSIRIREFVLTRKINIQKDTDELTGLKNKAALTREINDFLADAGTDKGVLFILDVDRFKSINDTYGHDIGDRVINQLGAFIAYRFTGDEIAGRFGGDEFIVFIKNTDDKNVARETAEDIITGASEKVLLPDSDQKVDVSIGIAVYNASEKNYSEIFKKADMALYTAKADPDKRFYIYGEKKNA